MTLVSCATFLLIRRFRSRIASIATTVVVVVDDDDDDDDDDEEEEATDQEKE